MNFKREMVTLFIEKLIVSVVILASLVIIYIVADMLENGVFSFGI